MSTEKSKRSKRYETSGMIEAQFEQGSHDKVLKNLLRIKTVEKMDQAEALALEEAQDLLIRTYDKNHRFTAQDICRMHLVLIHPFREGNGRISRLLAILMALQAGLPILNFSDIQGKRREVYFMAVREGMKRNYKPMEAIFKKTIENSVSCVKK